MHCLKNLVLILCSVKKNLKKTNLGLICSPSIKNLVLSVKDSQAVNAKESMGPVVQSIVSLTSSLRGQLVKCFMIL